MQIKIEVALCCVKLKPNITIMKIEVLIFKSYINKIGIETLLSHDLHIKEGIPYLLKMAQSIAYSTQVVNKQQNKYLLCSLNELRWTNLNISHNNYILYVYTFFVIHSSANAKT